MSHHGDSCRGEQTPDILELLSLADSDDSLWHTQVEAVAEFTEARLRGPTLSRSEASEGLVLRADLGASDTRNEHQLSQCAASSCSSPDSISGGGD